MELDQILKQLEWLDGERRKDKDILAKQEERIIALEGNLSAAHQQIKDLASLDKMASRHCARAERFEFLKTYTGTDDVQALAAEVRVFRQKRWPNE